LKHPSSCARRSRQKRKQRSKRSSRRLDGEFFVSLLPRARGSCVLPVSRAQTSFRSWQPYFVVK
jgi:hypothetical protein